MTEQLVPATPEVPISSKGHSRYICVGLDALSATDELVAGVSNDLQQVIVQMKQATHVQYLPTVKVGAMDKGTLHTLIQVRSAVP